MGLKRNLLTVVLVLFIVTVAITFTINARWLYQWDINYLNILNNVDVNRRELLLNYDELMRYLNLFWVNPLVMPDFPTSDMGAFHFFEVKKLFQLNYLVLAMTSIPSVWFILTMIKEKTMWLLIRPFTYILTGIGVILFGMLVAFDAFFVLFHSVFFNNDAWIFDPYTDPIILALPQDYFLHCFILFFVLLVTLLLIGILVGKGQLKQQKNNQNLV